MKLAVFIVALALFVGCASAPATPSGSPTPPSSWLGMDPGDVRTFSGPAGRLVLLVADESYSIDGTYASALIWKQGRHYTTDYVVEDPDGTVWWYGRKGSWRAGRHGASPREVPIADGNARFGDRAVTVSEGGPVELQTPDGVYRVSSPGA